MQLMEKLEASTSFPYPESIIEMLCFEYRRKKICPVSLLMTHQTSIKIRTYVYEITFASLRHRSPIYKLFIATELLLSCDILIKIYQRTPYLRK